VENTDSESKKHLERKFAHRSRDAAAYKFIITLDSCSVRNEVDDGYSEEWAEFILLNRRNKTTKPAHNFDIVFGPIANDRVGVQLWKYEIQSIDLPTLVKNLRHMKGITYQYFFGTEKAIKLLKKL
jgi:hypothetical protein